MGAKRKQEDAEDSSAAEEEAVEEKPKKKRSTKPEREFYSQTLRPARLTEGGLTILTWNVASMKTMITGNKEGQSNTSISDLVASESADILVVQEHKLQDKAVSDLQAKMGLHGWRHTWLCSQESKGQAGVAIFSRIKPLSITRGLGKAKHDAKTARVLTAEFESFYLVNVYVPNSGAGCRNLDYRVKEWDPAFFSFLKRLEEKKPVILAGDVNCAPTELDIHSPATNKKSPGFTPEERESFAKHLGGHFVDVWREKYPTLAGYTYWHQLTKARARNSGWRIDMFLLSKALVPAVHDAFQLQHVFGSDHCPAGLTLKLAELPSSAAPAPAEDGKEVDEAA